MDRQNINDIFERVCRSILSSRSLLQLESAEKMVNLFRQQTTSPELSEKLELIFQDKANALHYFEWKKFRDFGSEAA